MIVIAFHFVLFCVNDFCHFRPLCNSKNIQVKQTELNGLHLAKLLAHNSVRILRDLDVYLKGTRFDTSIR
jgi:hypothetical protein